MHTGGVQLLNDVLDVGLQNPWIPALLLLRVQQPKREDRAGGFRGPRPGFQVVGSCPWELGLCGLLVGAWDGLRGLSGRGPGPEPNSCGARWLLLPRLRLSVSFGAITSSSVWRLEGVLSDIRLVGR